LTYLESCNICRYTNLETAANCNLKMETTLTLHRANEMNSSWWVIYISVNFIRMNPTPPDTPLSTASFYRIRVCCCILHICLVLAFFLSLQIKCPKSFPNRLYYYWRQFYSNLPFHIQPTCVYVCG